MICLVGDFFLKDCTIPWDENQHEIHHIFFLDIFLELFPGIEEENPRDIFHTKHEETFLTKKWLLPTRRARFGAVETLIEAQPISPSIVEYIFDPPPPNPGCNRHHQDDMTFLVGHPYQPSGLGGRSQSICLEAVC